MHSTCTSYVLYAYLYCVYAPVDGQLVFVIRISVPFTSLYQQIARCLPQSRCLYSENVAIGFKTGIEAYFVGEKIMLGHQSCSRLANYAITFEQNVLQKSPFLQSFPYCDESVVTYLTFMIPMCEATD